MALLATRAKLPFVHVVLAMAVQAPLSDFGDWLAGWRLLCVTGITLDTREQVITL